MHPAFIAGFVAAEGCFTRFRGHGQRFTFSIGLSAVDREILEAIRDFFGVGHVTTSPRRAEHYDDEVTYAVQSIPELLDVIVPFMDEHLPPSYKRQQYLEWRDALLHHARVRGMIEAC